MPALGNPGVPSVTGREQDRPLVSMEGWARFEQRARERRIEKRLAAAEGAIRARRFAEARAALTEVAELNPTHPQLRPLTLQLTRAERPRARGGAYIAAAAVFAGVMLAASWLGNPNRVPVSEPAAQTPPPVPVAEALLASRDIVFDFPVATTGAPETSLTIPPAPETSSSPTGAPDTAVAAAASEASAARPVALPAAPADVPLVAPTEPPLAAPPVSTALNLPAGGAIETIYVAPTPVPERVAPAPPPPATAAATPAPNVPAKAAAAPVVDDAAQVRSVLQKYQAAYERLDASLVQAVWPGVNEAALARAFQGLESQTLTFRDCDVQLRGAAASVVCTGSTRYVPKIGSREPHVEPLSWTFTLRKRPNDEWQIESARADR